MRFFSALSLSLSLHLLLVCTNGFPQIFSGNFPVMRKIRFSRIFFCVFNLSAVSHVCESNKHFHPISFFRHVLAFCFRLFFVFLIPLSSFVHFVGRQHHDLSNKVVYSRLDRKSNDLPQCEVYSLILFLYFFFGCVGFQLVIHREWLRFFYSISN